MLRKVRALAQALLFGGVTLALLATQKPEGDDLPYGNVDVGRLEEVAIQGEALLSENTPEVTLRLRAVLHGPETSWLELSFSGEVTQSEGGTATDAGMLANFVDASLSTEGLQEPLQQTFLTSFGLRGRATLPPQCQDSPPSCEVELEAKLKRRADGPGAVRIAWSVSMSGASATPADGGPSNNAPWTLELATDANPAEVDAGAAAGELE
jgi:hypothetical protein